jgi:exonuclease SbcC
MIEFDYKIVRDEGDREVIFEPTVIPKSLKNLVYIKAANSSGKSTFLNILAIGLYGLKNPNIDESLIKKMNGLIESNHQTLEAKIVIQNRKGQPELISTIRNGKYEVKKIENGKEKLILPDRFEREYNLIYDIPHNPTERLNELTQEIENYQRNLGSDVSDFSKYLTATIKEIQDSRDPNKLKKLETEFRANEAHLFTTNRELATSKEKLDAIQKLLHIKFFIEYKNKKEQTQRKITQISTESERQKGERKTKRTHGAKLLNDITLTLANINKSREELIKILNEYLPETQKDSLMKWKKIKNYEDLNLDEYISDDLFGDSLSKLSSEFATFFSIEGERKEYKNAIKEWEIYTEIIQFFQSLSDSHKNQEIILPGIERTIDDFVTLLYSKNEQNSLMKQKYDAINGAIKKLIDIKNDIDLLKTKYFKEFVKQKEVDDSTITDKEDLTTHRLKALGDELKECQRKYDIYREKCSDYGITSMNAVPSLEKVLSLSQLPRACKEYTENQLVDEINELGKEVTIIQRDKKNLEGEIKHTQKIIETLRERKVHKFHDKVEQIHKLFQISQVLSQKLLKKYGDYIKKISERKVKDINLNDKEQKRYYEELSAYLAKMIDSVIYIGKTYKVAKLDLINEEISTKDGKKIRFLDFGTGESQATFLRGILETARTDKRRIIALFDEVGMIDDKRLAQVTDSLKKMYEEDQLLLGIVVQKGQPDEVEIEPLI